MHSTSIWNREDALNTIEKRPIGFESVRLDMKMVHMN